MSVLSVTNLSKVFKQHHVIDSISFSLPKKRCVALIGPNGAGKTTTLRMLTGLIKPTSGNICWKQNITDFRTLIGYLPQHPVFYHWMTGKEFLVYCGELTNLSKKEIYERTETLLERVGIAEAKDKRISTYSGGMKQRLGIAQAIIHQPKLLILDEPVSALDPIGRREVLTLMDELKKEMTILFSTHILSDADEISDEFIVLHQGKIVEQGSMTMLRDKYQTAKIELAFDGAPEQYVAMIEALPTVTKTTIERELLLVYVTDIERARNEILQVAMGENWSLSYFNINRASLEELFMKVVKV